MRVGEKDVVISLPSRPETIVRELLSIFGARPTLRLNSLRVFQFLPATIPKRLPKRARSGFQSRAILQTGLHEPAFLWPKFQPDRRFPELVRANGTTRERSRRASLLKIDYDVSNVERTGGLYYCVKARRKL